MIKNAQERTFGPGEEVLMLRLIKGNKLQLPWIGLYTVVSKMNDVKYILKRKMKTIK